MARPKQQQDRRKAHVVSFRLTDAEFARLAEAAARARVRFNELARRLTVSGGNHVVIKASTACDPAYLKRLDQIGHNLNQLVKNAHIFGSVNPRVGELCNQIETIVTEAAEQEWEE